jgi:hypothetical protein
MDPQQQGEPWKWSYSKWVGIMYGPVPVGVIVVGVIALIYYGSQ